MTFIELVKQTGVLPNSSLTETGNLLTVELSKSKLGYTATFWCGLIANPQDHIFSYGTGSTEEQARNTLLKKIMKD